MPVVEEDIAIGKREVERGHVRIYSRVTEQPVEESVRLREEKVTVERRPADRPATEADFAAAGKDVIEMTEKAEEPVVTKRARVVEEVVVHKDVTEHTETVRGTERRTDVDVQREPETATATRRVTTQEFATYNDDFRKHCATAFAGKGAAMRTMSQRTAMATSWARTSATGGATGSPWKRTPAATGKHGIRTPGSASKTPSAMAGTKSAPGPRAAYHPPGTASAVPGVAPTVRRNFHIPTDSHNAFSFWGGGAGFSGSPRGLGCRDQLAP